MVSEESIRSVMLPLPGVFEVPGWGMHLYLVGRKAFVTVDGPGTHVTVRVHMSHWLRLVSRAGTHRKPVSARLRPGWIRVDLSVVELGTVRNVCLEAWRHAAGGAPTILRENEV
ncbi:hypothetical protein AB0M29_35225 [Streptomyces sp. NPDC051976]|uniref:hypothetical protein n=1 Tax=Streptomyces sp. NPDC051976 TaxID=3154947 RepID=UPI003426199D